MSLSSCTQMYLIRHSGRQARRLSGKQAFHWKFVLTHRCRTLVPLQFLAISAVLSFLFHHCYSCQKTSDRNNNDGKASLKRQISPETTTGKQDVSKFFIDFEGKMFIFQNIYPRNLTPSHTTRDAFMKQSLTFSRGVSLGCLWVHLRVVFSSKLEKYLRKIHIDTSNEKVTENKGLFTWRQLR